MPGTNDALAAQRALRERRAIVRARCADGVKVSIRASEQNFRLAHVERPHFSIFQIADFGQLHFSHEELSFRANAGAN